MMTPSAQTSFLAHVIIGAAVPDRESLLDLRLAVQNHLKDLGIVRGVGDYGLDYKDLIGDDYVEHDEYCRDLATATWTGRNGVTSLDDLIANPSAQRGCFANKLDAAYVELGRARSFEVHVNKDIVLGRDEFVRLLTVTTPINAVAFAETANLKVLEKVALENGFETPLDMLTKVCVENGSDLRKDISEEITFH